MVCKLHGQQVPGHLNGLFNLKMVSPILFMIGISKALAAPQQQRSQESLSSKACNSSVPIGSIRSYLFFVSQLRRTSVRLLLCLMLICNSSTYVTLLRSGYFYLYHHRRKLISFMSFFSTSDLNWLKGFLPLLVASVFPFHFPLASRSWEQTPFVGRNRRNNLLKASVVITTEYWRVVKYPNGCHFKLSWRLLVVVTRV